MGTTVRKFIGWQSDATDAMSLHLSSDFTVVSMLSLRVGQRSVSLVVFQLLVFQRSYTLAHVFFSRSPVRTWNHQLVKVENCLMQSCRLFLPSVPQPDLPYTALSQSQRLHALSYQTNPSLVQLRIDLATSMLKSLFWKCVMQNINSFTRVRNSH